MPDWSAVVGKKVVLAGHFSAPVLIESAKPLGNMVSVQVRSDDGAIHETILAESELTDAVREQAEKAGAEVTWAPPEEFRLLIESRRIGLAYSYDPYFAVSLSGIRSLPHQLEAVYGKMLPQARLRFLLADDPGAGKTIMTGLLIKELKLRAAVERVLIIVPAALTVQWQDELQRFFNEYFVIINADNDKQQVINPWTRESQVVCSLDYAKQAGVRERVWAAGWDLVIVDEAHKCSAYTKTRTGRAAESDKTKRYELIESFSSHASLMLLFLTATPHQGNEDRFGYFLHLLDPDLFPEPSKLSDHGNGVRRSILKLGPDSPWVLRRLKEDLRDFDGRRLFPDRYSNTVTFDLSPEEYSLYSQVNEYLNRFLAGGVGSKKQSIALTRTVFQRRLASSACAIYRSLDRRFKRLEGILRDIEMLPLEQQRRRLLQMAGVADDERDEDDLDESDRDSLTNEVTAAEQLTDLQDEVAYLRGLVSEAGRIYDSAPDNKLTTLRETLRGSQFSELKDGRGKLLVFTEHRDTMDYLSQHLQSWGYSTCNIHGGMNPHDRKRAQEIFRTQAQICVATEAAGEGINLQFCHLLINYDLPWNPARLEQRLGRIHRIGQEREVYAFNFVAERSADGKPVIEGRILKCLLDKLETIRAALGSDRVYDVIGQVLALNEVNLSDMLRDAALFPGRLSEYEDQIERLSLEKLQQYEQQTGIALARAYVDFPKTQEAAYAAEERRLMPEYIAREFLGMADKVGLRVEPRADGLWRIPRVPRDLRSETLTSVRRYGQSETEYNKVTFRKEVLDQDKHLDAVLLSPGHPLYAAVDETYFAKYRNLVGEWSAYVDAEATEPYYLHFFESSIVGDYPKPNTVLSAESVCVRQAGARCEFVSADVLHDLTPLESPPQGQLPEFRGAEEYLRLNHQMQARARIIEDRRKQMSVINRYLEETYNASEWAAQVRAAALRGRFEAGEKEVALALQEAEREVEDIKRHYEQRRLQMQNMEIVRPGSVRYLGSSAVFPASAVSDLATFAQDLEAKARSEVMAMDKAMAYETKRGWHPTDVSTEKVGFDIRSFGPPDPTTGKREIRRIEVKGRMKGSPISLTENEWRKAKQLRDTYWLYVAWQPDDGRPEPFCVQDPAEVLGAYVREIRQISRYEISAEAILSVAHQE